MFACWLAALCLALAGCAAPGPREATEAAPPADELIIVAVDDPAELLPAAGGTPRAGYAGAAGYAGSTQAAAVAAEVAQRHGLREQKFWRIAPLRLRCALYRIAPGADRAAVLAQLARDPQVQLAQPLNEFETLAATEATLDAARYNDPYFGLQRNLAAIDAAQAQRWSQGQGVRVALIDTGVDASHPDLAGRIAAERDFAAAAHPAAPGGERHGTEMAGVIAAAANNRIGIVGVAPQARLWVYRACWAVAGASSRCDSFTLAQALGAAIAADADIINLSLGGPADPLLQRLLEQAMKRGAIVVGALPPGGRQGGFPVGVPGVLAVASADDDAVLPRGVLVAPGRDILTLVPGGHYDYASGSSLAAAHVTGAVALLRTLNPALRGETAQAWLALRPAGAAAVDVCHAVRRLRAEAVCSQTGP